MAANSADKTGLLMPKKHQDGKISPERTNVWIQSKSKTEQKVPVVYYLTSNGRLEHPHFVEVPLSSPQGLQLRDVIHTLNRLRGQGMANMYSWSSKRSYKNGFVWQDLSENDFIYPCHGHEYILKGSQLLETSLSFRSYETKFSSEINSSSEDSNSPVIRRKNHSWTTFNDLNEYKIYTAKTTGEFASKGANVSTQTDDNRRVKLGAKEVEHQALGNAVLSKEKVSPALLSKSYSSVSERLKRSIEDHRSPDISNQMAANDNLTGRMKTSMLLMKLIGCGSKRFK